MASDGFGRVRSIDSLRGFAALVVVIWHYQFYLGQTIFEPMFFAFYRNGQIAVDVFFVISGFILSYVYLNTIHSYKDFRRYVKKRIARMYPLHLLTLFATVAIFMGFLAKDGHFSYVYGNNDAVHFFLNLMLMQSIGTENGFSFNGPAWSISTEFWVNIFFGLMLLCGFRSTLYAAVVAVGSAALLLYSSPTWSGGPDLWGWVDSNLLRTIAGFYAGVLTFKVWRTFTSKKSWHGNLMILAGLAGIFFVMTLPRDAYSTRFFEAGATFLASPLLVLGCTKSRLAYLLGESRFGTWIGNISFSIYLWHFPVAALIMLVGAQNFLSDATLFAVYMTSVLTISTYCFRYVEAPARDAVTNFTFARPIRVSKVAAATSDASGDGN